ncbi:MAG: hypothetical protein KDA75_04185 [Planctomycetaceae bacterium]|nr:hypothetical protein [Planctomycetaceae bacterium]
MDLLPCLRSVSGSADSSGRSILATNLLARATKLRSEGDYSGSRVALATAVTLDPSPAARYALAALLADLGEANEALEQLQLAWEHARRVESPVWRSRCCHALADLYRSRGEPDMANRYRQWAIRADLDADADVDTAAWLADRAAEALAVGDTEDAETLFQAVDRLSIDHPERKTLAECNRAAVCLRHGRWSQAIRLWVKCFQRARQFGDLRGCADMVVNVGHTLQARGQWRRAQACFSHAGRLLARLGAVDAARRAMTFERESLRWQAAVTGDPRRN